MGDPPPSTQIFQEGVQQPMSNADDNTDHIFQKLIPGRLWGASRVGEHKITVSPACGAVSVWTQPRLDSPGPVFKVCLLLGETSSHVI